MFYGFVLNCRHQHSHWFWQNFTNAEYTREVTEKVKAAAPNQ
jgi:hypothetical protein